MGILAKLEQRSASPENPSTNLANPAAWFTEWATGGKTPAGVHVNNTSAMGLSAVYACIRVIAETIASLPLPVYRRLEPRGKERAKDHGLYGVLHDRPNPEMSAFTFWETFASHMVGWGNGYAEIEQDGAGRTLALWPLLPDRTESVRLGDGTRAFRTRVGDEWVFLAAERVLHVPGLGFDGRQGYNPITLHRQAIGLGLAAQEFGERYFGNGSRAAGVLTHPGKLAPDTHKRLKESWAEMHTGLSNAHRAVILEDGMTWQQTSIPPEEAQFIETRKFQIAEIARIFRVPPHLIADLERATFSNIEQQSLEFVIHTIRPWLVRLEKAINHDLFLPGERGTFFAEFLVDGLLRGDLATRYTAYQTGRNWGWLSANDVRELENQNPIPDGDQYLVPLNMIPADKAGVVPEPMDTPPAEEDERAAPERRDVIDLAEKRRQRSITARRRLEAIFEPMLEEVGEVVFRRETNAAERALDKAFKARDVSDFSAWIDEFYGTHPQFITERSLRVIRGMALAIQAEIADELGGSPDLSPEVEEFVRSYGRSMGEREVGSSVGQLRQILRDTQPDEVEAALRARLDEWKEKRAKKFARRNAVRAQNALTREAYLQAGVTTMRWVTVGANCPICTAMNGRTVSITGAFLRKGETLDPGVEGTAPLTTKHLIRHPPLHDGCDCTITAA